MLAAAATQAYSQSSSASCDGATGSSHSSAPPVDTNQIWYEAVDGKEKMPVYGVGSSTSSFYSHRRPDYEAPSSGPFSNLFSTMEDFLSGRDAKCDTISVGRYRATHDRL